MLIGAGDVLFYSTRVEQVLWRKKKKANRCKNCWLLGNVSDKSTFGLLSCNYSSFKTQPRENSCRCSRFPKSPPKRGVKCLAITKFSLGWHTVLSQIQTVIKCVLLQRGANVFPSRVISASIFIHFSHNSKWWHKPKSCSFLIVKHKRSSTHASHDQMEQINVHLQLITLFESNLAFAGLCYVATPPPSPILTPHLVPF